MCVVGDEVVKVDWECIIKAINAMFRDIDFITGLKRLFLGREVALSHVFLEYHFWVILKHRSRETRGREAR